MVPYLQWGLLGVAIGMVGGSLIADEFDLNAGRALLLSVVVSAGAGFIVAWWHANRLTSYSPRWAETRFEPQWDTSRLLTVVVALTLGFVLLVEVVVVAVVAAIVLALVGYMYGTYLDDRKRLGGASKDEGPKGFR